MFSFYHLFYRILKRKKENFFFSGTLDKNVITQKTITSLPLNFFKNVANRQKRKVKIFQNHIIGGYREI